MPAWFARAVLVAAALAFVASPADAAKRVALVIGNSAYVHAPALANPKHDAADMAAALREIGFEVVEHRDAGERELREGLGDFVRRLPGAEVAVLFYAGHGLQFGEQNYILPVDLKVERPLDVQLGALNLATVIGAMTAEARASIVFLDACRDNPFAAKLASATRSAASRGLARLEGGVGSLIAFATAPGDVAADGTGRNSPFTAALLKHIRTPGLEIRQVLSRVRTEVRLATNRRQTPWDNSSLEGDVFLMPAIPAPDPPSVQAGPSPAPPSAEIVFWQSIERAGTRELYEAYLKQYGETGIFAPIARQRIAALTPGTDQGRPGTSIGPEPPASLPQQAALPPSQSRITPPAEPRAQAPGGPGGSLGVRIHSVTKHTADTLGLREVRGVVVTEAERDSPAAKAGIRPGDVVLSLDGEPVKDAPELMRRVAALKADAPVRVGLWRKGRLESVDVRLGSEPPASLPQVAALPPRPQGQLSPPAEPRAQDPGPPSGSLGVRIQSVTKHTADTLGLREVRGAVVTEAERDGPAARAGIRPGDVVLSLNGEPVKDALELMRRVAELKADTPVRVGLWRKGRLESVEVRLGRL